MPNHVINEIIFRGVDRAQRDNILAYCLDPKGHINFEVLLPVPLNVWRHSVGERHEKAFRVTGLDWARENWGTKWNAYGIDQGGKYQSVAQTDDTLTLTFQTAWRPPYGWINALFNKFNLPIEHNWLDEGTERGVCGKFTPTENDMLVDPWIERPADNAMHRHLHKLLWGVEEFEDDDAA